MDFTYGAYRNLLERLDANGYTFCDYGSWKDVSRCVILRHDIDESIEKAVELAKIENSYGIKSVFFVLMTSDLYNVLSYESGEYLKEILRLGHDIGLHFDEVRYPEIRGDAGALADKIKMESRILSSVLDRDVRTVSMHRPSKDLLEKDLQIDGMINSYSSRFFKEFKYVSDSRRRWREPVEEIIDSCKYDRLHILTHAIWYTEESCSDDELISSFVNSANMDRYDILDRNITDLESFMKRTEVLTEGHRSR